MKLENLIVQYLYRNKSVRLQDIGTFTINPDVFIPADAEKDVVLPTDSIKFEYDPRAKPDEGLVEYVIEKTRKIRPLAISDLESFSNLNRQFINIGKPLVLEGIGALSKNNQGIYEFYQGKTFNTKVEAAPVQIKEKAAEEISYESAPKPRRNFTWVWVLVGLLVLASIVSGIYYYMKHNNGNAVPPPATDTTTTVAAPAPAMRDSSIATLPAAAADTGLRIALRNFTTRTGAANYIGKLQSYGHKLDMRANADSTAFTVYMAVPRAQADSLRVRDSLKRFFGGTPYVLY